MLKNSRSTLPVKERAKVYVPKRHIPNLWNIEGEITVPGKYDYPIDLDFLNDYYEFTDRSYRGKTIKSENAGDIALVAKTREEMGEKPVVVILPCQKRFVPSEFEPYADAVLISFGVEPQAYLDIISGRYEPTGLLPIQFPANMKTVEIQNEDSPRDMECYVDADGNAYDFAFGLNWSGVIDDDRVKRYK